MDKEHLLKLLLEHKKNKKDNPQCQMSNEFGKILLLIVDKMLESPKWKTFPDEHKEEFKGKALEILITHVHRFKVDNRTNCDSYTFIVMIISGAFISAVRKIRERVN